VQTIKLEAKRLYDLGFGILWLKKKSKAPVKLEWTTGPRDTWEVLDETHVDGFNVGVRLGAASKIGDKYLAAVDQDVKSSEPRHQAEMLAKFKELFPELKKTASALTGRGGGSRHNYILTSKPAKPRKLAQSPEKVKVHMPGVKGPPSKQDLEKLTKEEIAKGFRIRPAWEIALMGEGQQVVLPPSVHQDTGREYIWQNRIESISDITHLQFEEKENETTLSVKLDFKAVHVDLEFTSLPASIISGLTEGEDVEDRSAFMLKAAIQMVRAGFTDNEMASVLTDPDTFIGQASYEHAKTTLRSRAAAWALKYCVLKARREADARFQFESEVETEILDAERTGLQVTELLEPLDWRNRIERNGPTGANANKPKNTLKNTILILQNEMGMDVFKHNEFSAQDIYGCETPWGGEKKAEVTDVDFTRIKSWFADRYRFEPTTDRIVEAVVKIADDNRFHPVRDYILSHTWDGEPRLDTWLKDYVNAEGPEPYLSAVSRKIVLAMVARVFLPGCKFDHIPVLEGKQGKGKSSAARILASDEWFADNLPDLRHADARLNLRGKWLVEMGELAQLKRSDLETIKGYITSQSDRVRAPYGRKAFDLKRQSVFFGTTNEDIYLKDKTGNRRFWCVKVGQCDFDGLRLVRDQLFAEAYFIWENAREPLWLEGEARDQAEDVQSERVGEDEESIMAEKFHDFMTKENKKPDPERFPFQSFGVNQLFDDFGPFNAYKADMTRLLLATKILKNAGFEKYRSSGTNRWRTKSKGEGSPSGLAKRPTMHSKSAQNSDLYP
jgi:Virulence-associated protein E/Bifunctional DNA primase/polymerase, N-terminal